jgi:hypothetical protein
MRLFSLPCQTRTTTATRTATTTATNSVSSIAFKYYKPKQNVRLFLCFFHFFRHYSKNLETRNTGNTSFRMSIDRSKTESEIISHASLWGVDVSVSNYGSNKSWCNQT